MKMYQRKFMFPKQLFRREPTIPLLMIRLQLVSRRNSFLSFPFSPRSPLYLIGVFLIFQKQHAPIVGISYMLLLTQHIYFSSQPYHCPTLGKGIPLFNSSSQANLKPMLLIILYATSVFVSYQRISKAKILRIQIQVFSGIFLLVNTHPLLVHHTTIMLYTLVRTFGV